MDSTLQTGRVLVRIVEGPLAANGSEPFEGAGAVVRFEGIVRPTEDGRPLRAIDYTAYLPMARRELGLIAERAVQRHGLIGIELTHSRGVVPIGAASLRLVVAAAHRKPALAAVDQILDDLKRDVPIWKNPVFAVAGEEPG